MSNSHQDEPENNSQEVPFLTRFIATGFFTGYIPWASGTFGTLAGALFFLIPGFSNSFVLLPVILAGLIVGVYAARDVANVEGNRLTSIAQRAKERFQPDRHDTPDPSIVVIDEIVGMWITMFALHISFASVAIGFLVFRAFDIVKPYPARQVERYGSGWGIMLDDVVAGIYANIVTRIILALLFQFFPGIF